MSLPFSSFLNQRDVRETNVNPSSTISYYSVPACAFVVSENAVDVAEITDAAITAGSTLNLYAPVYLPQGATVTSVILYGSEADEQFILYRQEFDGSTVSLMATGNWNVLDSSILNSVVNNASYAYYFVTSQIVATDAVWGAIIAYTT